MTDIVKHEPPINWRLILFLIIINIHLLLLIFIYFNLIYLPLIVIELIYYVYNFKIKNILRMLIICLIVMIFNSIFYEGKIIFQIGRLNITLDGIINGLQKSMVLFALFLFTNNVLKNKSINIIQNVIKNNDNLIVLSIKYFYSFWDIIDKKFSIRNLFKSIIRKYRINKTDDIKIEALNYFEFKFIIYNIAAFMLFISILFLNLYHINFINIISNYFKIGFNF